MNIELRDYFAAQAIKPLIENFLKNDLHLHESDWMEGLAMDAYSMAEAMIQERQEQRRKRSEASST